MTQNTKSEYPKVASVLALVGGILIILCGTMLVAVSTFILPHINYSNVNTPPRLSPGIIPSLVSGIVGTMGVFALISGIIVLVSAIILLTNSSQRRTLGVLILVFSVLSFLGLGGFVVGAILGVAGGILTLTWKPPAQ
ncbi:MAG TPA: DUF6114 domain-containing protein [Candidatus Dormibacteraeota bacterium]|nr:DUF6114 domain-containing protein [Candidatus Dormibacteraeota bacterium]